MVADTGTGVSHNPTQNFKLWSGIAPVYRMRQLGVRFGIGTDGSSFNDDNDIWTELRLGWFLARPPSIQSEKISPREWISRCIQDGNRIAMQSNLGSLAEGKTGDLILVDGRKIFKDPDTHPDLDPWLILLHRTQGIRDVHTVMIGGRIVRRKGKSVVVDEVDIERRFRKLLKKRYQRVRKDKPFFAPILEAVRENFQKWEEESDVPPPDIHRYNQV